MRRSSCIIAFATVACFSDQPTGAGTSTGSTEGTTEPTASNGTTIVSTSTGTTTDTSATATASSTADPDSSAGTSCDPPCAPGEIGRVHWLPSTLHVGGIEEAGGNDLSIIVTFGGDQEIGGTMFSNPSGTDLVLARMDEAGVLQVAGQWDGSDELYVLGFAGVPSGRVAFVCAYASGLTTPGGTALPGPPPDVYHVGIGIHDAQMAFLQHHSVATTTGFIAGIDVDTSNRVLVAFSFSGSALLDGTMSLMADGSDGGLWRIEADGSTAYARTLGGSGSDAVAGLVYHGADLGPARLVGEFSGPLDTPRGSITPTTAGVADAYVAAVDGDGLITWARRIGGDGPDLARGVAVDGAGAVYVFGHYDGTLVPERGEVVQSEGSSDLVLGKYAADGSLQWQRHWGSVGEDQARGLGVADGVVIAVGETRGAIDFDGHMVESTAALDAVVLSVDAESGDVRWARGFGGGNDDRALDVAFTAEGAWVHIDLQGEVQVGDEVIGEDGRYAAFVLFVP